MSALVSVVLGTVAPALAADDAAVNAATRQVERGARKIGDGEVARGVEETAKGVGRIVVEGARFTGEKLKEAGKAAERPARRAGKAVEDGAHAFGQSVTSFFTRLSGN